MACPFGKLRLAARPTRGIDQPVARAGRRQAVVSALCRLGRRQTRSRSERMPTCSVSIAPQQPAVGDSGNARPLWGG